MMDLLAATAIGMVFILPFPSRQPLLRSRPRKVSPLDQFSKWIENAGNVEKNPAKKRALSYAGGTTATPTVRRKALSLLLKEFHPLCQTCVRFPRTSLNHKTRLPSDVGLLATSDAVSRYALLVHLSAATLLFIPVLLWQKATNRERCRCPHQL
jgi:hypothetical protein